MKKVNVNDLVKYLNEDYVGEFSVDDFNNGSGVYGINVGSRGEIEDIFKVNVVGEFKLRSKEELINEKLEWFDNEEEKEEFLEYSEEFINSGEIDWNDLGGVYEGLSEEESIEYYDVVV
jgi:hypothetical protein